MDFVHVYKSGTKTPGFYCDATNFTMHIKILLSLLYLAGNGAKARQLDKFGNFRHTRTLTSYDPGCYQQDNDNSSTVSIDEEYRRRYFNLFTRRGKPEVPTEENPVYSCWDVKYASIFEQITSKVRSTQMFAGFDPRHQEAVLELQTLIQENIVPDPGRLITFLEYLNHHRSDIHPQLFLHSLSGAQGVSKWSLWDLPSPALPNIFPTKFFKKVYSAFAELSNGMNSGTGNDSKCLRVNEFWGKTNGIENRLWYFREDIQLNMHHWRWHLFYPATQPMDTPPIPRRGELFSFFHHDLMARYAAERLANGFKDYFVQGMYPRDNLVVDQGYDSNLRDGVSSYDWVNRPNKTVLNQMTLSPRFYNILKEIHTWHDRVGNVSKTGIVSTVTNKVMLIPDGINSVGELFEASSWTLNKFYYGNWHNQAHNLIGRVIVNTSQPNAYGVLTDTSTALRDIVFFRIHQAVDNMFTSYKHHALLPYHLSRGDHPWMLPGIRVHSISLQSDNFLRRPNRVGTFWSNRNLVLDGGLDFNSSEVATAPRVNVCVKHLNHEEFVYRLELENQGPRERQVLIRIFMAPRYNPQRQRWRLREQFPLFFVMDTFAQKLHSGVNRITRKSSDSTVTSPWWTGKEELSSGITRGTVTESECTCGYPEHLLIPKGTESGMAYDLVAVVSDGRDYTEDTNALCSSAWVLCGRPGHGQNYPDQKPMGWPWDRRVHPAFARDNLETFMERVPNMKGSIVFVRHDDRNPGEHQVG